MSNTVDERIVRMQFDNTQFEQNVQTSLGTLGNLKQALDFGNTSKSLDGLNDAVKNNKFSYLGSAIDSVTSKFSALEIAGITAIANITNSVVNKLKSGLDAITVRPLMDGFKEYETQLDSVQTIMANTGKSVGEVNASLDAMNQYADKTIYNFQEMASNLGRFTAAGTELETSQQAIMGISNLAAVSGSNSYKASVAMYQLSQAIAAGALKLQDWNSVVNAGMGGKVFQDALQRTAQHMLDANVQVKDANGNMISYKEAIGGTTDSIKKLIADQGSFRESLRKGWITTDVLTETLRQFQLNVETTEDYNKAVKELVDAGYTKEEATQIADMAKTAMDAATKVKTFSQLIDTTKEALGSGWAKTWQIVFGDFEEAKAMWTEISNVINDFIGKNADARNKLLETWKKLGGRTALLDGLKNAFLAFQNVLKPIQQAFSEVFKPLVAFDLFTITKNFRDFTAGLRLTDEAAQKVHDVFHGLFSVIHAVGGVFGTLSKLIGPIVEVFKAFFEIFLDIASEVGQGLTSFSDMASQSDVLGSAVEFVSNVLLTFASTVRNAWKSLKEFYSTAKESLNTPGLNGFWGVLKSIGSAILTVKDSALNTIRSIKASFAGSSILDVLKQIWTTLKEVGGGLLTGLANGIKQVTSAFKEKGGEGGLENLLKILTAGGIGLAIKKLFEFKKALSFTEALDGVKELFSGLADTLSAFQGKVKAEMLFKIAAAVGILAVSLLILSSIEPEKLNTGIKGMTAAFAELVGALAAINSLSINATGVGAAAAAMILMSIAVLVLAAAVKTLSKLSIEELAKGLISVEIILKMISQFLNGTYFDNKGMVGAAIGMLIFAAAIRVLVSSVKALSALSIEELVKGLVSVGVLLKMISMFLNGTSFDGKRAISNAIGILIIAAAIKLLGSSVAYFGSLDWGVIGKGLAAIGGVLLEIAAFSNLAGNAKHVMSSGMAVLLIAIAMRVLYSAMASFGSMDWEEIKKGLTSMGIALMEMTAALNLIPKGSFGNAVSLVVTAASLLIVAKALEQMGAMEWETIKRGLTAMGGALLEMVVALTLLQGGIAGAFALLILAAALAVLVPVLTLLGSLPWDVIGKGLLAIAGLLLVLSAFGAVLGLVSPLLFLAALGLTALGVSMGIVAGSFALFGIAILSIAAGLRTLASVITLLPAIGEAVSSALGSFGPKLISSIIGLLPQLGALIVAVVTNIAAVLMNVAPIIFAAVLNVINSLLNMLALEAPIILNSILNLILGIIVLLSVKLPMILQAIINVFLGILVIITQNIPVIIAFIANLIIAVIDGIRSAVPRIITAATELIVAFLDAISANLPQVINAAFNLIISFIEGLADAIDGNTDRLVSAIEHLINAVINAAISLFAGVAETFLSHGRELFGNFVKGIAEKAPEVLAKVKEILGEVIAFVVSHAPEWLEKGKELIGKLASGIAEKAPEILKKVKEGLTKAANFVKEHLPEWLKAGKDLVGGFIKGIGEKIKDIPGKLKELGGDAIDALKEKLDSNSPSKVFETIGVDTVQGYINGIDDTSDGVEKSTSTMGEKAQTGFLDGLKGLGAKISELFGGAKDTVESKTSEIAEAGSDSMDSMAENAESGMERFNKATMLGMQDTLGKIRDMKLKWMLAGKDLAMALARGVKENSAFVKKESVKVSETAYKAVKDTKSKWESVGKALGEGLGKGIKSKGSYVKNIAEKIISDANAAAKKKAQSHSPSKVWMRLGEYLDEGLIIGMQNLAPNVNRTASDVIGDLTEAAKGPLDMIADLMSSDIVDDPVIRPVMDLSEIQNGANQLYSMMDEADRYTLTGNVDLAVDTSRSVDRDQTRKRKVEDDNAKALVSAITALKDLVNAPRNTYVIDGITYDDGSNVSDAIRTLVRAAKVGGRA